MEKKRNDLFDLDFYTKHTIEINGILVPINIHIKNIQLQKDTNLHIFEDGDHLEYEYEKLRNIENFKWYLKFINVKDKLFEGFTKNFLEYNELESIDELLYIFDEMDFKELISHCITIINAMMEEFRERLYDMLKIKDKVPNIKLKEKYKMPENIKEYLKFTYGYTISQMAIEHNPTIFFPENKNKAIIEWSFREFELHLAYLTIKSRIESTEDRWQAKVSEEIMNQK